MPAPPTADTPPERYDFIDTAKIVLIVLVIFGHLIETVRSQEVFGPLYHLIYGFHIPAFFLIAGMFTRPTPILKVLKELGLPLLIFTFLYEGFYFFSYGRFSSYLSDPGPHWILWFLYNLLIWRVALPYLVRQNIIRELILGVSIVAAIGLSCLHYNGYTLGLSRLYTFLPFFLGGYYYRAEILGLCQRSTRWIAALIFAALSGLFLLMTPHIQTEMLWGSYTFPQMNYELWQATVLRLFLYMISTAMSLALLCALPTRRLFFTSWGADTLYIYLGHGFLIYLLRDTGVVQTLASLPIAFSLLLFLISSISIAAGLRYLIQIIWRLRA